MLRGLFLGLCCLLIVFLYKHNKYDFTAYTQNEKVTLNSFDGKYKVLYFGYLFCPDVCPITLEIVGNALNSMEQKRQKDDLLLLFATIDPDRDTPENLTLMAKNFYKNSVGLKVDNLERVTKNYGVKFQKIPLGDNQYSVAHSSKVFLIDKDGKFFTEVDNLTPNNVKNALQKLIKQRP